MFKKSYYTLIVLAILIILLNTVFASKNISSKYNNISSNVADNFYNNIIVSLNIDYGQAVTQNNYVTLNLDVKGQNVDLNSLKVQFSLDNQNWSGYNSFTQRWENGFFGEYQPFYYNFYIGYSSGLKTVYTRVIDSNGNVGLANAKINFSSSTQAPHIVNPQSIQLNNFQGPLNKAGIKNGSGTLYDPYIISSKNTRLVSKMPNVSEVSYYMESGNWSPWYKVNNEQADIPITFNSTEGLKEVRLRSRNKYGIEGDAEIIYYLLDYSKPKINIHTNYHSFIAIDGRLQLELEINDNLSDTLDFVIEVSSNRNKIVKEGKIKKYDDNKSIITPVVIEGLPEGKFNVKVIVKDEAGNESSKQISVNSV